MAVTTITRTTWTDDSGSPASPAGDGTTINNAELQKIYQAIDDMVAGAFTVGGVLGSEALGVTATPHLFSASGAGHNIIRIRNASAGTDRAGALELGNDIDPDLVRLEGYSTSYTETGAIKQDGAALRVLGTGGLSLAAEHASGNVRLYAGGTTKIATYDGNTLALSGGTPGAYRMRGVLDADSTSQATTGTVKETLYTFALPASTLARDGDALHIMGVFTGTGAANKTVGIDFGGTTIGASAAHTSTAARMVEAWVVRTGATAQVAYGQVAGTSTPDLTTYATPSETLSGSINITFWATTATAGQSTYRFSLTSLQPAP